MASTTLVAVAAIWLCCTTAAALDNGLALTPPMGWLSWEADACDTDCDTDPLTCISEDLYKRQADLMVSEGYAAVGYQYINIDDCWMARNRDGDLIADPTRFPSGLKALADYVHGKGLKLGTYSDIGSSTCGGFPAMNVSAVDDQGPEPQYVKDVKMLADAGIDSLKVDGCNADPAVMNITYPKLGAALNATGRPILYSCSWPDYVASKFGNTAVQWDLLKRHCNGWRNFNDIWAAYDSVRGIIVHWANEPPLPGWDYAAFVAAAGPGSQNDPDQIVVGGTGLSQAQSELQFGLWAIFSAPLLMTNDLATVDPESKRILQNKEVIAVNQDKAVKQGTCVGSGMANQSKYGTNTYVFMKPLSDGSVAAALANTGSFGPPILMTFTADMLSSKGLTGRKFRVRDLFRAKELGTFPAGNFSVHVPSSGVVMVKVTALVL